MKQTGASQPATRTYSGGLRHERRDLRRRQLVDVAADLFRRQGYEATSIDAVAAAAGVTKGAVYSNFTDKSELLFATIAGQMDPMRRIGPSPRDLDDLVQSFARSWKAWADAFAEKGHVGIRLERAVSQGDGATLAAYEAVRLIDRLALARYFAGWARRDGLVGFDSVRYVNVMWSLLYGARMLSRYDENFVTIGDVQRALSALLPALTVPATSGADAPTPGRIPAFPKTISLSGQDLLSGHPLLGGGVPTLLVVSTFEGTAAAERLVDLVRAAVPDPAQVRVSFLLRAPAGRPYLADYAAAQVKAFSGLFHLLGGPQPDISLGIDRDGTMTTGIEADPEAGGQAAFVDADGSMRSEWSSATDPTPILGSAIAVAQADTRA